MRRRRKEAEASLAVDAEVKQAQAERLATAAWERVDELRRAEREGAGQAQRVVINLTVSDGGSVTFNGTAHSGR